MSKLNIYITVYLSIFAVCTLIGSAVGSNILKTTVETQIVHVEKRVVEKVYIDRPVYIDKPVYQMSEPLVQASGETSPLEQALTWFFVIDALNSLEQLALVCDNAEQEDSYNVLRDQTLEHYSYAYAIAPRPLFIPKTLPTYQEMQALRKACESTLPHITSEVINKYISQSNMFQTTIEYCLASKAGILQYNPHVNQRLGTSIVRYPAWERTVPQFIAESPFSPQIKNTETCRIVELARS